MSFFFNVIFFQFALVSVILFLINKERAASEGAKLMWGTFKL